MSRPPLIRSPARAILEPTVADVQRISELLIELDGIANAPMTAEQRLKRAEPLLDAAGLGVLDLVRATTRAGLPWNQRQAQEYGVSADTWLLALRVSDVFTCQSVADLLDRVHRAAAAAAMLRAGYRPQRDTSGRLSWVGPAERR